MYFPNGDHRQIRMIPKSSRRIPESCEVCQLMVTNETSNDSVVLTKDTGIIRGLLIDDDQ